MNESALAKIMISVHQKAIAAMQKPNAPKSDMDSIVMRQQAIQRILEIKL